MHIFRHISQNARKYIQYSLRFLLTDEESDGASDIWNCPVVLKLFLVFFIKLLTYACNGTTIAVVGISP